MLCIMSLGQGSKQRQRPLDGKGTSKQRQWRFEGESSSKATEAKAVRRQSVNCTTVTSKHPLYSQTIESWYGWVGECCITSQSRSEDVAAVGVDCSFICRALAKKKMPFDAKGHSMAKAFR